MELVQLGELAQGISCAIVDDEELSRTGKSGMIVAGCSCKGQLIALLTAPELLTAEYGTALDSRWLSTYEFRSCGRSRVRGSATSQV